MSYTTLVTQLVGSLPAVCDADTRTVLTAALVNAEAQMQQHFTGKAPKKQRKSRDRDPDAPKKTNWQAVWTSNANGCRAFDQFADQLTALQTANPAMGRFEINKQLKESALANGQYAQWQEWAKARLVAEGKPIPMDKAPGEEVAAVAAAPVAAPAPAAAPKPRGKKAAVATAATQAVAN